MPGHYAAQIQHQFMVGGAAGAHLWVFDDEHGLMRSIERAEAAIADVRAARDTFAVFLDTDTPPPLVEADTVVREDEAWAAAAQAHVQAKQAEQVDDEALDRAKEALVALAEHPRKQGSGVTVTCFRKAGNVDYKKVAELRGVDLDAYRGQGREEIRVRVAG